jgi:hypothetical protein
MVRRKTELTSAQAWYRVLFDGAYSSPALTIKTKMFVDDALGLGLTGLVKPLAEALEKV